MFDDIGVRVLFLFSMKADLLRKHVSRIRRIFSVLKWWAETKLGPILFAVMVNDLIPSWGPRVKFVDHLIALEIVPRNSPSLMRYIANEINDFAVSNNMKLNHPGKCKEMRVSFLRIDSCEWQPIAVGGTCIESVQSSPVQSAFVSLRISLGQFIAIT